MLKRNTPFPALLAFLAIAACGPALEPMAEPAPLPDDAPPEEQARVAGERWLELLDRSRFGDTWVEASELFRRQVNATQWENQARQVRQQIGTIQQRELVAARHETRVPNAPPGEYVVLQYQSSFSRRPSMTETLTMQREALDGRWRMAGYFVTQN